MVKKAQRWKPRPGEVELLGRVRTAADQIDREPGGRLGWLVRFVREDPERWLPGEAEAHGFRLLALVFQLPPNLVGGTSIYALTPRQVVELHTKLRTLLQDAVRPGSAGAKAPRLLPIPTEGLTAALVRASAPGVKPAIFAISRGGPFESLLFQEVAKLIVDSDRLIACPTCGKPFLALRKMKFCSSKCTQRWHDRQKVEAKKRGLS